ncbi:MAG: hypothetical protein QM687_17240 [Ferruginibacter sp.]
MQILHLIISLFLSAGNTEPIYNYNILSVSADTIRLDDYRGKKILLVNIATGSSRVGQLQQLQQLQQQYASQVRVIAFPSNSFGNEPLADSAIAAFCSSQYSVTFPVAVKAAVTGNDKQALYQWLGNAGLNGAYALEPREDFKKYLISSTGEIVGSFAGEVSPLSDLIVNAITNPNN